VFKDQHSRLRAIGLLLVLFVFFGIPGFRVETATAGEPSEALNATMENLRSDREKQQALAKYAKGVFLFRLGLGAAVIPPSWAAGIQRPCFVTFFSGKRVIACSGGFSPRTADLGREIEANVSQALHMDPRAGAIERSIAESARVLITFPGELRAVAGHEMVDPVREGLFVENDRSGVAIVPGEAKTASWAYREALRRLGESDPSRVRRYAFDCWAISGQQ
jgi:hypothetical protein